MKRIIAAAVLLSFTVFAYAKAPVGTTGTGGSGSGTALLPATASRLGGIKVGAGLSAAVDGTLTNTGVEGPQGPAGPAGPAGSPGATGPTGAQGVQAPSGRFQLPRPLDHHPQLSRWTI